VRRWVFRGEHYSIRWEETMRVATIALTLALCCGVLTGCNAVVNKKLTLPEFRSFCKTYGGMQVDESMGDNSCDPVSQDNICNQFVDAVSGASSWDACTEACNQMNKQLTPGNVLDGCMDQINYTYSMCQQYCQGNFSK